MRLFIVFLLLGIPSFAQLSLDDHLGAIAEQDDVDKAVEKGLEYLVERQKEDGSFDGKLENTWTALACIALMANGHFPGRSKYGENLRKGILYLVEKSKQDDGYFGKRGESRMYGHGICTLALSEAYGMLQEEHENVRIKEALERAVAIIIKGQVRDKKSKHFGGWRYQPDGKDADLSVAVWQVLALRSSQNCQIEIPDETVQDSLTYVRAVFDKRQKGFSYQGGSPSVAMKSAGVVGMLALGANKTDKDRFMVENSASYLLTQDPKQGGHFWYQSYYLATAANMMGEKHRSVLLPKLEEFIVSLQKPNGEFQKHKGHAGEVYSTAFALICLAVRDQYLPIYQE